MTASLPAGVLTSGDQVCMEVVARLTAWQRRGGLLRAPYLAVLLRGLRDSAPVLAATGAARDRNPTEGALIAPPRPRAR